MNLMNELRKYVQMYEMNMLQFVIAVRIIVQWVRIVDLKSHDWMLPIG